MWSISVKKVSSCSNNEKITTLILFFCISFLFITPLHAQSVKSDTVKLSLSQFIEMGLAHSDQVKAEETKVELAKNTIQSVKDKRFFPKFNLMTNHSVVPGVSSDSIMANGQPLPKDQYYLDPNLKNDWSKWSIYSQVQLQGVQPLFTWGALNNAINAAKMGAKAAEDEFTAKKSQLSLKLYQLFYSRILAMEMDRLLSDAQNEFDKADKKIKTMQKNKDPNLSDSDVYKFKIYEAQFDIKAAQVKQNVKFIRNVWNLVLGADSTKIYLPNTYFLNPVDTTIKPFSYYRSMAIAKRPELKGLQAAEMAAKFGIKAKKSLMLPTLFLGLGGEYVYTPRPTERTPMLGNRFSYANLYYTVGIRENLDFWSMKNDVQKMQIQYDQIKYSKQAAVQGITLEIDNSFKKAKVAETTYKQTENALQISTKWLRQEQINYDLGLGSGDIIKNLLDAVKANLELEAEYRQKVYDYNLDMAKLYQNSGISLTQLH